MPSTNSIDLLKFNQNSFKQQIYSNENSKIKLIYLPLNLCVRDCCLLISNEIIGQFVLLIRGIAQLPKPSFLPFLKKSNFNGSYKLDESNINKDYRLKSSVAACCKCIYLIIFNIYFFIELMYILYL